MKGIALRLKTFSLPLWVWLVPSALIILIVHLLVRALPELWNFWWSLNYGFGVAWTLLLVAIWLGLARVLARNWRGYDNVTRFVFLLVFVIGGAALTVFSFGTVLPIVWRVVAFAIGVIICVVAVLLLIGSVFPNSAWD
jgi:hypothetical protein